jgi:hypothetical protein
VSPIRARVFNHESTGVSPSINAILETVTSASGINRKTLAEHLAPAGAEPAELEKARLTLASDLHWLVSEGYIIEFNDGSLDLPRTKPPVAPAKNEKAAVPIADASGESAPEVQPIEAHSVAAAETKPAEPTTEAPLADERPAETAVSLPEETAVAVSSEREESSQPAPEASPAAITITDPAGISGHSG